MGTKTCSTTAALSCTVSGLTNEPAPCNVALSVEAVRFRLIRLALSAAELADKEHLRNRVAYRLFAPGFLCGTAGIGYQLLRLAHPSLLPSALRGSV